MKYRVLIVATHPAPYAVPIYRRMTKDPRLEIQVAYCTLQGAEKGLDPGFGVEMAWDVPLLDGYPWIRVPNRSLFPGLGRPFGLINPGLWSLIRKGGYDAIIAFTGYLHASFWIALISAKKSNTAFLFGTDAYELRSRDGRRWKFYIKAWLWPHLFRLADVVIVPSTGSVTLMRQLGIPSEHIALTPFVVDNDWWLSASSIIHPLSIRQQWGIPENGAVILFCAKLQPWKRPFDALNAFAKANIPNAFLVFAGEGPLRAELEKRVNKLGLSQRVRFLGFVNQSQLPGIYRAADLFILPSEYEPFGVVVNEAMLCGTPVIVSDRVGARYDLVREGETGFVYPCGDIEALSQLLREVLPDRERLKRMGESARQRMETWSPRENIEALVQAVEKAVARRRGKTPSAVR